MQNLPHAGSGEGWLLHADRSGRPPDERADALSGPALECYVVRYEDARRDVDGLPVPPLPREFAALAVGPQGMQVSTSPPISAS